MIVEPERWVGDFRDAGADRITVHAEVSPHLHRTLQQIRELGAAPGLAVNPLTPLNVVRDALPLCDTILVMTVNPGFGGQSFIEASVPRVEQVRMWRDDVNPDALIEVDGGIDSTTAPRIVAAGADVLVAGSAVFGSSEPGAGLQALREATGGSG
jgi:ribulose-phosphate 3-epimerase